MKYFRKIANSLRKLYFFSNFRKLSGVYHVNSTNRCIMTDEGMFRTLIRLTWVKGVNRLEVKQLDVVLELHFIQKLVHQDAVLHLQVERAFLLGF